MVKIVGTMDPTLQAADAALVRASKQRKPNSLGASWIADECERRIFLKFRHAKMEAFEPVTLKRFEDGHRTEDLVIARLKAVEGLEWHDKNPETNWQYGFSDFGGHFKGFYDGVVLGLLQAPRTWHIGEVKASEKWDGLDKAKAKLGEKNALAEWNYGYYIQAQLYMHYEGVTRHYMVAASPGGRFWTSARTDADSVVALRYRAKAERIIFTDEAPERIGDATDWRCRWCHLAGICHGRELPERACRNCIHASPLREGGWHCAAGHGFGGMCSEHRYLPSMLNAEQLDVVNGGDVVYRWRIDGGEYVDCGMAAD